MLVSVLCLKKLVTVATIYLAAVVYGVVIWLYTRKKKGTNLFRYPPSQDLENLEIVASRLLFVIVIDWR